MIKWQSQAIRALLSESDNAKPWGYLIDIENDTMKDIWGVAASLSMDAINAKATELKNASEYIDNRVGITSGYSPLQNQLDQLWHDIDDGKFGNTAKTGSWYVGVSSVKTLFPKP